MSECEIECQGKDRDAAREYSGAEAWEWFESVGRPVYWLAPMVGQSECAFRMLARRNGAHICSTEMIDAAGYARSESYRAQFPFHPEDRPLIVQLGGSNPADLAAAAALAAPHCAAVELNVGCPQRCAKKGGYGAFLMEKRELLAECVRSMADAIRKSNPKAACLVKIRCFDDVAETVELARMVRRCGCQCLTVHGRTRVQGGGKRTGRWPANWEWIRAVKQALDIPVISNGNIRTHRDIEECLAATGADGVMSGCGMLRRPWIFLPQHPYQHAMNDLQLRVHAAAEYLSTVEEFSSHPRQVSKHIQNMIPAPVMKQNDCVAKLVVKISCLINNHVPKELLSELICSIKQIKISDDMEHVDDDEDIAES
uniref:DUS-like FMN-binding domain-containing protein n=2 Tax=Guillardia theta TaxID=55529 RepID=A0A7S4URN9_GUITH|mmetsp:Transcript_5294/g.18774  ORF Transcript_5294/g.18774 Transcript_5294/m.18774 type:complete len:369 (+) Transcript_5294:179-1285(+)